MFSASPRQMPRIWPNRESPKKVEIHFGASMNSMNNGHRVIFHIDMNSYFASCEQQANPHLRGRPVGVCEHLGGIIIAPSVEAKRFGIKTAMPVWEAQKICPDIILLSVDPPKYREITRRFLKIFSEYTDLVEHYSIDEAFLDVSHLVSGRRRDMFQTPSNSPLSKGEKKGDETFLDVTNSLGVCRPKEAQNPRSCGAQPSAWMLNLVQHDNTQSVNQKVWRNALMLALEIKWRVKREVGEWLTCSVGAAQNKLLAKIASDMDKPDGVVVIKPEDTPELYHHLRLTDIPGIGSRLERQLNLLGIFSLRQLAQYPESLLRAHFGIIGHNLHEMGNFRGGADLITVKKEAFKSMGHAYTMPRPTSDEKMIKKLLFRLSEKVAARLRRRNYWGSEISCFARFVTPDKNRRFSTGVGRSRRIHNFTNDGKTIFKQVWRIFQSFNIHLPVRMVGVTVAGLAENYRDEPLFARYKKPQWALSAQDSINGKYGDFTLRPAFLIDSSQLAPDTVGFPGSKSLMF